MANQITQRPNYFMGQFLKEADFRLEQDYHVEALRIHNRVQHTWGIASGLELKYSAGSAYIAVTEGTAIDSQGRSLNLAPPDYKIDFSSVPLTQDTFYITISYNETFDLETEDTGIKGFTRIKEEPLIKFTDKPPVDLSLEIFLGKVVLKSQIQNPDGSRIMDFIDISWRKPSGVKGGDMEIGIARFSSLSAAPDLWPKISSLEAAGATKLSISTGVDMNGPLSVADALKATGPLSVGGDGLIGGNLQVNGNLTVAGTTTTINAQELAVKDNIIRVNEYAPQTTPQPVNGGLEVFRGGNSEYPEAQLIWDESVDRWKIGTKNNLFDLPYGNIKVDVDGKIGIGTNAPMAPLHVVGGIIGAATDMAGNAMRVVCGKSDPAATGWNYVDSTQTGLYTDIDITGAAFGATPFYFVNVHGNSGNWALTGVSTAYDISATGFRLYVRYHDGSTMDINFAKTNQWHIHWMAVGL